MEESRYHHTYGDCNSMPWDEIDDALPIQALQHEKIDECSIDGCLSNDWRRIGLARRKFLLEDDRRKGGTNFDLNISCTVDRYFQVAHRVCG